MKMNDIKETNQMHMSWCDSQWLPVLNSQNVLDYFSERSNPFYDRTCNNEILKMQRLPLDQLNKFQGIEYIVLHCQEPILYVVRKQDRMNPNQATPIADYYIIAGVVYQAPDLYLLINSRILTTVHHLQSAFEESLGYARYHPSKGYWFEFGKDGDKETKEKNEKTSKEKTKEEMSSSTKFQRKRVDILLSELTKKFPPKLIQAIGQHSTQPTQQSTSQTNDKTSTTGATTETESKVEVKVEKIDTNSVSQTPAPTANSGSFKSSSGPPEKKPRLN